MLIGRVYRRLKFYLVRVACWFVVSYPRICYCLCKKNLCCMDMQTFVFECSKYASLFHAHSKGYDAPELQMQIYAFTRQSISLISNSLEMSENPCEPTVLAVVKDDLERMKLFYRHYQDLGVKQFVVIDNGSTDGTLEWMSRQQGTRCYSVTTKFQSEKKVAWIEKALALTGYNRWYVVVDSDELLDYIGSEQHDLKNLILHAQKNGYKHLNGYMLDMYSDKPLFTEECKYNEIVSRFRYFDVSGYYPKNYHSRIIDTEINSLIGGPRERLFKNKEISLNKQSVFYFNMDALYCNPHYLWPYQGCGEDPCSFVLRHYKFLKQDLCEFEKRIEEKNFWNGSQEYRMYMAAYQDNSCICMKYNESVEYKDSHSLAVLPFLKTLFKKKAC